MAFKYQLDTSSKKFVCPNCGMKRMVRYVAYEDRAYLNSVYGRCDREVKCGCHLLPGGSTIIKEAIQKPQKEPFFIAKDVFKKNTS